ncbi:MAG: DUF1501 domain-containing protein [Planctomycetaceae bacterium]
MISRRDLLKAVPAALAFGATMPRSLLHAAEAAAADHDANVLVVVQLSGGNDGLNTVVPYRDPIYRATRPTLAIAASDILEIDQGLGFHPAARGFADLLEAGRLAIVQGVGYDQPNRSHFESMDIWHTCQRKHDARHTGWLGRYLDTNARETRDAPAIHLGGEQQPLALRAEIVRTPTIRSLDEFHLQGSDGASREMVRDLTGTTRPGGGDLLDFVQSTTTTALDVSERFSASEAARQPAPGYPATSLGQKLGTIARLITSGLGTRVYYVEVDGFDTHAQQAGAHEALLRQVGDAVARFVTSMAEHQLGGRVLVMCFSEFGRRVAENASEGTDHGAAAPMFLAGDSVKPGLIGNHPSLTDLIEGDLKHHTDFRQVYAAILERWLRVPAAPLLHGEYRPIDVLRTGPTA